MFPPHSCREEVKRDRAKLVNEFFSRVSPRVSHRVHERAGAVLFRSGELEPLFPIAVGVVGKLDSSVT